MVLFLAQLPEFPPIEDIDAPMRVEGIPWWVWAAIAVLAAIGLIILSLAGARKRKSPPPSPREKARRALSEIERKLSDLSARDAAYFISDVLRTYLHEGYGMPATTQTTEEFLETAALPGRLPSHLTPLLGRFLRRADEAKFSPSGVESGIRGQLLQEARDVVSGVPLEGGPSA